MRGVLLRPLILYKTLLNLKKLFLTHQFFGGLYGQILLSRKICLKSFCHKGNDISIIIP